ncbi:hypothetical protein HanPI659440_Chr15g0613331 [Helianthus annuus]|nr:hypothetical protein HanPI659440_Chr15g0613331 [Helianthus annuus]
MNIITCLILNRRYNILQVIFNHMLDNIKGEMYVLYPRFVQMLLDDQIQNLPKADGDELRLEHMDSETLKRLDVYRGVKKGDEPMFRQKFVAIKKADYEAPKDDKWRHDNSDSGDETKKMELLILKKTRWWIKEGEKTRKRTPKVTTPKVVQKGKTKKQESPRRLVDESFEFLTKNVNLNVAGDTDTKKKKSPPHLVDEPVIPPQEVAKDDAKTTENVEAEAGGETLKEKLVEGEVHTDSSETESELEVTQIAPTSYVSGKFKLKKTPKKKKASDEEDATYEPTPVEKEKLKKKRIRKRKARPTGELPKRHKVRKVTTSIPEQIPEKEKPESIEVEITVQSEFKIATPPPSPVQRSVPIPEEVREKTPKQPPKTVEEPSSATKKPPTPQSSSHGFLRIPSDLGSGPTGLEDFGDFFNDGKVNALTRKVS